MPYEPTPPDQDLSKPENLSRYLLEQLREISKFSWGVDYVHLPELNVEPVRPREGMIVLADGTNWDPGSGAGFYGYRGGSWVLLG